MTHGKETLMEIQDISIIWLVKKCNRKSIVYIGYFTWTVCYLTSYISRNGIPKSKVYPLIIDKYCHCLL